MAAARKATAPAFHLENLANAQRAKTALDAFQAEIDARMGEAGPGFTAARAALKDATHSLERMARLANPQSMADSGIESSEGDGVAIADLDTAVVLEARKRLPSLEHRRLT